VAFQIMCQEKVCLDYNWLIWYTCGQQVKQRNWESKCIAPLFYWKYGII